MGSRSPTPLSARERGVGGGRALRISFSKRGDGLTLPHRSLSLSLLRRGGRGGRALRISLSKRGDGLTLPHLSLSAQKRGDGRGAHSVSLSQREEMGSHSPISL